MRMTRPLLSAAALIALAACEKGDKAPPPGPALPAVEVSEVAAADGYGEPGAKVNAVAFWSHPSVNFESLLLAATDAGVEAFAIETGEKVGAVEQGPVDALAVIYSGNGAAAEGYVVAGRPTGYEFYRVDNLTRALSPTSVASAAPRAGAFCAGRSSGAMTLYEIANDGLSRRVIEPRENGLALGDPEPVATTGGIACHVDDRTGAVIAIAADGAIKRIDPATGEAFGLAFGGANATSSTIFLMTTVEPDNAAGGAIALLDGASGVISLFDLVDGHAMGAVRVKATFDLGAVAAATTIAAGYGNYGGVYRDGALAIVTNDGGAPIRLAPWNGVLDAVKQPLGENVDPRAPQSATEDVSVIEIDLIEP